MQDSAGPWNGIYVNTIRCEFSEFECAPSAGLGAVQVNYAAGTSWFVQVLGTVTEINGTTQIASVSEVKHLKNGTIPSATYIETGTLGLNCTAEAEAYESVLIVGKNITITSNLNQRTGEIALNDGSGRTELDDAMFSGGDHLIDIYGAELKGQTLWYLRGIALWRGDRQISNWEIHPRAEVDIHGLTFMPSADPTMSPLPSYEPTLQPFPVPTISPFPSAQPTLVPTEVPTGLPSLVPSAVPTLVPTEQPSLMPSLEPTPGPTLKPTALPSLEPTLIPSSMPTLLPTTLPSGAPTGVPSYEPSLNPLLAPSGVPSLSPTDLPSYVPTSGPTRRSYTRKTIAEIQNYTRVHENAPTLSPTTEGATPRPTVYTGSDGTSCYPSKLIDEHVNTSGYVTAVMPDKSGFFVSYHEGRATQLARSCVARRSTIIAS